MCIKASAKLDELARIGGTDGQGSTGFKAGDVVRGDNEHTNIYRGNDENNLFKIENTGGGAGGSGGADTSLIIVIIGICSVLIMAPAILCCIWCTVTHPESVLRLMRCETKEMSDRFDREEEEDEERRKESERKERRRRRRKQREAKVESWAHKLPTTIEHLLSHPSPDASFDPESIVKAPEVPVDEDIKPTAPVHESCFYTRAPPAYTSGEPSHPHEHFYYSGCHGSVPGQPQPKRYYRRTYEAYCTEQESFL